MNSYVKKGIFYGILLAIFSTSVHADCLNSYDNRVSEIQDRIVFFSHEKTGKKFTTLGIIAETLGATAIGATAGGAVGFVLPYAITGLTYGVSYGAASIAGAAGTVGLIFPIATAGAAVGAGIAQVDFRPYQQKWHTPASEKAAVGALVGIIAGAPLDLVALGPWVNGPSVWKYSGGHRAPIIGNMWTDLMKLASKAGHASAQLIPMAGTYFLPIGAILGGGVGLTIGVIDAAKKIQIRNLLRAQELLKKSYDYSGGVNAYEFIESYDELPKKVRRAKSVEALSKWLTEESRSGNLCKEGPLPYSKLMKAVLASVVD